MNQIIKRVKEIFKKKCPNCKANLTKEELYKLDEYNRCECSKCGTKINNQYW